MKTINYANLSKDTKILDLNKILVLGVAGTVILSLFKIIF